MIFLAAGLFMMAFNGSFFNWIGWVLLGAAALTLIIALFQTVTASPKENLALEACEDLPYKYFFADSGIGLDPKKKELHLYSKPNYKVYSFEDIRRWETNSQTGGQVYGTGLAVVAANLSAATSNVKNSGLFIEVRDIDLPRWRIAFAPRKMDKELPRWMEILRQHVNES